MQPRSLGAAALLCLSIGSAAQITTSFLGTWKVTWQGERKGHEAKLVVAETGGTWKTYESRGNNPCIGREAPIQIEQQTADTITVRLKFSEALTGCKDDTVKLTRVDDNSLQGTRGSFTLKATRDK